ncbi:MAG: hypothetical protein ACD_73C00167G0001 [uncultured bacterium]|nr:MAG: hypothetical protein ACD_73C00167G0001 [uncultured bacterium]
MKLLVVDDSKAMRMIVIRNIRQAGYDGHEIKEATNGVEGLAAVKEWNPDLVLSDWNMPEMTGIQFLQQLRAEGNQIKFGFVTSEGTPEMRQLAADSGCVFLIAKPFTVEDFKENLARVLS